MKKVKRWRYYCGFCKKSGGSGGHMKNHELSCTKNPDRTCGFCDITQEIPDREKMKSIVNKAVEKIEGIMSAAKYEQKELDQISEKVINDLLEESCGCPACVIAALRQNEDSYFINFDYQKAKAEFWENNKPEPDYSDYH